MSTQESIHMSDTQTFKSGINQLVTAALNNGGCASLPNCQTRTPDGQPVVFEIIAHAELKALPVSNTGEPIKKESELVKFNCSLSYSSKDCDYKSSFQSDKNTPDQVLIDVIEHLGWMAGIDGEAKRAIAALNKGIARGVARKIELQSQDKPKVIEIDPTEELEGMAIGSNATEPLTLLSGLAVHVREAVRIGLDAAEKSDDGGSANLDHVILINLDNFPLQALLDHGLTASETHRTGHYALIESFGGQGDKRATGVTAMSKYLTKVGVAHYVHYQLD